MSVHQFTKFLLDKLVIFENNVELDLANCLVDTAKIHQKVTMPTKCNEECMVKIAQGVLSAFKCYHALDINFVTRLDSSHAQELYGQYKSDSTKPLNQLVLSTDVNTTDTFYIDTLPCVTTKILVETLGELRHTGRKGDKYRYEYPFRCGENTFVLYDWVRDDGVFETDQDITWYIAGSTDDEKAIATFKQQLQDTLCVNV